MIGPHFNRVITTFNFEDPDRVPLGNSGQMLKPRKHFLEKELQPYKRTLIFGTVPVTTSGH